MTEQNKGTGVNNAYGKVGAGVIVAILVSGCTGQFSTSSMQPIMALIATTWPDQAALAALPLSLMSLFMAIPLLFMGIVARYVGKKTILVVGSTLFFLGGIIPAFVPGFWTFIICRCLVGFGSGIVVAIPTSMISFLFSGKKQNTMLGVINAVAGGIAFCVSSVVGILAMTSLQAANWVYLLMLVFVILQLIFIPKFPPEKKDETIKKVDENGNKIKLDKKSFLTLAAFYPWKIVAIGFVYAMAGSVIRMGGTTADAGFVTSVMTAFNLIWSFAFIWLFSKFGNFVIPIGCFVSALSWLMLSIGTNVGYMYAWAIMCSFGMTMFYPWYWKTLGTLPPKVWVTTCLSFIMVGAYLMQFAAPYLMALLKSLAGGSDTSTYMLYFIIMAVFAVIWLFVMIKDKASGNKIFMNLGETKLTD